VQLDEGGVKLGRQSNRLQRRVQARAAAQIVQRLTLRVAQGPDPFQRDGPGDHARTETPDAETRRLLGGENHQLDRAHRPEPGFLQRLDGREAAQNPDDAVKFSRIGNGVNMRTGGHRRCLRRGAHPAGEHVAHRVNAQLQAGILATLPHKRPAAQIGIGKKHPRHDRRFRLGHKRKLVNAALQPSGVDLGKCRGHHPRRGARFTSL